MEKKSLNITESRSPNSLESFVSDLIGQLYFCIIAHNIYCAEILYGEPSPLSPRTFVSDLVGRKVG